MYFNYYSYILINYITMLYIKISSKINKCNVFTIVRMSRGSGHFIYNTRCD